MISITVDGIIYKFYDHLYAVSRCGKVLRKLSHYSPTPRGDGYATLGRLRLMHRVVATCWVENPTNAKHVHHINGIRNDNRADNLQWINPKEHISEYHHQSSSYIRTDETRNKYRMLRLGKKDSEETKNKKRISLDAYRNKTACRYNGIIYATIKEGAIAANLKHGTFRVRCLSKNFPNYELLYSIT